MAESLTYKHAFDFFYKWCPTGSGQLTNVSWSRHFSNSIPGVYLTSSWYDLGAILQPSGGYSTRYTASLTTKDGALAWASPATDLLWNVLSPSGSTSQSIDGAGDYQTYYRFAYNSESVLRTNFFPAPLNNLGLSTYPVTSSWIAYEPRMIAFASGTGTNVGYKATGTGPAYFPATIGLVNVYALPSSSTKPTTTYPNVGQNPTMIGYGSRSTGSNDGRFFDLAGGCGITRTSVSASLAAFAASASFTTLAARDFCTTQLKNRRLFFPTARSTGSVSADGEPNSWLLLTTGKPSSEFFTENGGIYNVKFNIKRDVTNGYYPDTGEDSQLLVYIHNINTTIPQPSGRVPGANGWYPPDNNIIRVKNNPAMSFVNPATGYLIESFNINVVQYGAPAQLVFEASGSLSSGQYFGCIIDDVEFCKIGVSTDPALIKPTTPGQFIEAQTEIR